MKILMATFWTLPHTGGLWRYVEQTKKNLENKGHEVDVLARYPGYRPQFYILGKPLIRIKGLRSQIKPWINQHLGMSMNSWIIETELCRYSLELAAASLNLNQYDIIHTQDVISTRSLARVKPTHVPLIATLHSSLTKELDFIERLSHEPEVQKYCHDLESVGACSSDKTIVPSVWLQDVMKREFSVPEDQLIVVPNGMDIRAFEKAARNPPLITKPPGKKLIICIARLTALKGHHTLLDALRQLKDKRTDWQCWIVGDGNLKGDLRSQITQLGLEPYVTLLGQRNDIPTLLKQSDIFVLPSLQENLPYGVMEAQVLGVPVIVSDAGGLPSMVEHRKTGFVFRRQKALALYKLMNQLLEDPHLSRRIGNNGKRKAKETWSIDTMISKLESLYSQLMHSEKKGRAGTEGKGLLSKQELSKHAPQGHPVWNAVIKGLPSDYVLPDVIAGKH
ncbi:glycosyltransferase involved in cell wall biosynthesis [Pullulanibacillus pueri]|uniref:Glycosyltransferase family 1 protein n=2 Tax=Pullulanibacillus pueri TaxID=1437324 RepID=A0A8J2ZWP1_9BACL|nr:glycosyltransferase family 4 protein [Pullulanibacillus pueri]MBM7680948.1 glycosyltransferase involved in cell wall biosynthesis [Pullulanibacillus pueri]GGH81450.1 hypothetical protein GCM10007096_19370 [Pullulanibacillus pueri]